jgi:hypothetical protein
MEEALPNLQRTSQAQKLKQVSSKLGLLSTAILATGTIAILATLRFLSFLWFSDAKNRMWQVIACKSWVTRAVTPTALDFRTAVSMQAGILTSMLAGLALERRSVLRTQLASILAMRNMNSGPFYLTWFTCKAVVRMDRPWKQIFLPSVFSPTCHHNSSFSICLNSPSFRFVPHSRVRAINLDLAIQSLHLQLH